MQTVSVGDGGKAIVGNVTQHASVIVSDKNRRPRRRRRGGSRCPAFPNGSTKAWTPGGKQRHERSRPQYRPDAGEPAVRRQNPFRRLVPLAGGARQKACRMHGGAPGSGAPRANQNARKHGLFTGDAIAERRQIQALLGEARKLLEEMK